MRDAGFLKYMLKLPYTMAMEAWEEGSYLLGFLAALASVLYTFLAAMTLVGLFYLADSAFVSTRETNGVITDLKHSPQHIQMVTTIVNNVTIVQPLTIPPSWSADVQVDKEILSCGISSEQFVQLARGQQVRVSIGAGRLSGGNYCKDLSA